jgi:hypothetical protein
VEPGLLLFSLLSQAPDVAAQLTAPGGLVKIFPLVAPQSTKRPYCCYQLIGGGPAEGSSAICRLGDVARVQLSIFADTYQQIADVTAAVRSVLDYAQPEPGVYMEPDNPQDHHDKDAACLFRSLDYLVELP